MVFSVLRLGIRIVIISLFFCCNALKENEKLINQRIDICEGDSEFPPYMYYERIDGERTNKVVGYSVDVLKKILVDENGAELYSYLPPWKRCLQYVSLGKYDIAPNSVYSEKRSKAYIMTVPYYSVTPSYFFVKSRFKHGPNIKIPEDYNNYIVCGLQGYEYNKYGVDQSILDTKASDFEQLFNMLRYQRCDIVLARIEPVLGFKLIGVDLLKSDVVYKESPLSEKSFFHMLISKKLNNRQELKNILDEGINKMKEDKSINKILKKYMDINPE